MICHYSSKLQQISSWLEPSGIPVLMHKLYLWNCERDDDEEPHVDGKQAATEEEEASDLFIPSDDKDNICEVWRPCNNRVGPGPLAYAGFQFIFDGKKNFG